MQRGGATTRELTGRRAEGGALLGGRQAARKGAGWHTSGMFLATLAVVGMTAVALAVALSGGSWMAAGSDSTVSLENTRVSREQQLAAMPFHDRDIMDVYKSHDGDVEERSEMRREGSLRESSDDRRLTEKNHEMMDHFIAKGQEHGVGGVGGVGSSEDGGGAWYSGWWKGMRVSSIVGGVERMTGLRGLKDGKSKLAGAGINVDGWEPGRTTQQVIEDQKSGHNLPRGFWKADGTPEYEADMEVHHPCGSPLRNRPCDEDNVNASQLPPRQSHDGIVDAWDPMEGNMTGPLWVDPWPMEYLVEEHNRLERERLLKLQLNKNATIAKEESEEEDGTDPDERVN